MATEGTDVRPDTVSDFGKRCITGAESLTKGAGSALGGVGSAKPGMSGIDEGISFADSYGASVAALGRFSQDAITGLQALGYGGITIAQNYRAADLSQAQEMRAVDAAFNPKGGTPSLASQRAAGQQAAAKTPQALPAPQPPAPSDRPAPLTPQQEVDRHTQRYGANETWRPPAPSTILAPRPIGGAEPKTAPGLTTNA